MSGQLSLSSSKGQQGASGATGSSGAGAQGAWLPQDSGLVAWGIDPLEASGQNIIGAGIVYLVRAKMATASAIGKVGVPLRSTAPAGCTNAFVGVYSQAGATATLLGQSADISASLNGNASPTMFSLSSATASQPAGTTLLIALLVGAGTTMPNIFSASRSGNWFIASKQNNRAITYGTGQTALPASMDLSGASASDPGYLLGLTLSA